MKTTVALVLLGFTGAIATQDDPFTKQKPPPVVGRWDLTVHGPDEDYPSWLEIRQSGYRTLVGSFVGKAASCPANRGVEFEKGRIHFSLPPQRGETH